MGWQTLGFAWLGLAVNLVFCINPERNNLGKYILHYEALEYDSQEFIANHHRTRRSSDINAELKLDFHSHGRHFRLRLRRDTSLFSDTFKLPTAGEFHPSNIYHGKLANDARSSVNGFVHNGIFEGRIKTSDGKQYHVEPSSQYFDDAKFHSVIYDIDNIHYPHPYGPSCGIKKETKQWMSDIQHSADDHLKYNSQAQKGMQGSDVPHHRQRRAFDRTKTACHLFMQADPTYTETFAKSEERALYLMSQHVKEATAIYSSTDFDGTSGAEGISFVIEKMIANTSSDCSSSTCPFHSTANVGVEKYLELNSEQDHTEFCLAYVFGYRDFANGVLGLAWIGEPSGAAGGICERHRLISGSMKSLNTGIVTTLNYGESVPTRVTDITFAHEIGHNFGAKHDDTTSATCSPGITNGGNYIMYPRATSGSDPNNFKFSSCSRSTMWSVIDAKSASCFDVPGGPICGNKIKEGSEECDCGWDGECTDKCCTPKGQTNACTFTAEATQHSTLKCSSSNGPCCDTSQCKFFTSAAQQTCSQDNECAQASLCDGASAACPTPAPKTNLSLCHNGAKVCVNGACTGSICMTNGSIECMCKTEEHFCDICCANPDGSNCQSWNKKQVSGAPCDNFAGYCDIFSKCRKVDAEGPLSRLKNWLLSGDSIQNILDWMKEYWWACILIGLGLILFMAAFIKLCSVHTPSSNPNMKAARHLSLPRTLTRRRRNPQTNPGSDGAGRGAPNAPRGGPNAPRGGAGYPGEGEHLPGYDTALRQPPGPHRGGHGYPAEYEMRHGYR